VTILTLGDLPFLVKLILFRLPASACPWTARGEHLEGGEGSQSKSWEEAKKSASTLSSLTSAGSRSMRMRNPSTRSSARSRRSIPAAPLLSSCCHPAKLKLRFIHSPICRTQTLCLHQLIQKTLPPPLHLVQGKTQRWEVKRRT